MARLFFRVHYDASETCRANRSYTYRRWLCLAARAFVGGDPGDAPVHVRWGWPRPIAGHLSGLQGGDHVVRVDDLAPGAVEDDDAFLHFGNGGGADHVARLGRQVRVQGEIVRAGENLV